MTNQFDKDLMSTFQLQNENSSLKQALDNLERQLRHAIADKEKLVTTHGISIAQNAKDNSLLRSNLIQCKKELSEWKDKCDEKDRTLQTALVQMAIKSDEIKFTKQGQRLLQNSRHISSMIHPNNTSVNSSKYGVREVMRQKSINDSLRQELRKLVSSKCIELITLRGKTEELQVLAELANNRANDYEKELDRMKLKLTQTEDENLQLKETIDTKLSSDLADFECKLYTKAIEMDSLIKKFDDKESQYIKSIHDNEGSEIILRNRVYELMSHLKLMRKNMIEVQIEMSCLLTVSNEECDQLKYDYAQLTSEMDRIVAENQLLMETGLQQDQLLNQSTQAFSQYVSDHQSTTSPLSLPMQQSQLFETGNSIQHHPQPSIHNDESPPMHSVNNDTKVPVLPPSSYRSTASSLIGSTHDANIVISNTNTLDDSSKFKAVPTLPLLNVSQSPPSPHHSLPLVDSHSHSSSPHQSSMHNHLQLHESTYKHNRSQLNPSQSPDMTAQSDREVIESVWLSKLNREAERHSETLRTAREAIDTAREEAEAELYKRKILEEEVTRDADLLINQIHTMQNRVNWLVNENHLLQKMNDELQNELRAMPIRNQQSLLLSHSISNSSFPSNFSSARSSSGDNDGNNNTQQLTSVENEDTESRIEMMISHQQHAYHINLLNQKSKEIEVNANKLFHEQKAHYEKMKKECVDLKEENLRLQQLNEHQLITLTKLQFQSDHHNHHHHNNAFVAPLQDKEEECYEQHQEKERLEGTQLMNHHQQLEIAKMQIVSMKRQFETIMLEKEQLQQQLSVTVSQAQDSINQQEILHLSNSTRHIQLDEETRKQEQLQNQNTILTTQLQESIKLNEMLQLKVSSLDTQLQESIKSKENFLEFPIASLTIQTNDSIRNKQAQIEEANKTQQHEQPLFQSQLLQITALRTLLQETNTVKEQLQKDVSTLTMQFNDSSNQLGQLQLQVVSLTHQLNESIKSSEQLQMLNSTLNIQLNSLRQQQSTSRSTNSTHEGVASATIGSITDSTSSSSPRASSAVAAALPPFAATVLEFNSVDGSSHNNTTGMNGNLLLHQQKAQDVKEKEAEDKMTKLAKQIEQLQLKLKLAIDNGNSENDNSKSYLNTAYKQKQQQQYSQSVYDNGDEDDVNNSYREALNASSNHPNTDWHDRASQLYSSPYRHPRSSSSSSTSASHPRHNQHKLNLNDSAYSDRHHHYDYFDGNNNIDDSILHNHHNDTNTSNADKQYRRLLIARCTALEQQIQSMPASLQVAQAERRVAEAKWQKAVAASEAQSRDKERETDRVRQELQAFLAMQLSEKDALTKQVQQQAATIHQLTHHLHLLQSQQMAVEKEREQDRLESDFMANHPHLSSTNSGGRDGKFSGGRMLYTTSGQTAATSYNKSVLSHNALSMSNGYTASATNSGSNANLPKNSAFTNDPTTSDGSSNNNSSRNNQKMTSHQEQFIGDVRPWAETSLPT